MELQKTRFKVEETSWVRCPIPWQCFWYAKVICRVMQRILYVTPARAITVSFDLCFHGGQLLCWNIWTVYIRELRSSRFNRLLLSNIPTMDDGLNIGPITSSLTFARISKLVQKCLRPWFHFRRPGFDQRTPKGPVRGVGSVKMTETVEKCGKKQFAFRLSFTTH